VRRSVEVARDATVAFEGNRYGVLPSRRVYGRLRLRRRPRQPGVEGVSKGGFLLDSVAAGEYRCGEERSAGAGTDIVQRGRRCTPAGVFQRPVPL
jgi:hypothetical protein